MDLKSSFWTRFAGMRSQEEPLPTAEQQPAIEYAKIRCAYICA